MKTTKPLIVAASDNKTMAQLAKPGLSATFDVMPLISKWSLEFQAGKQYGLHSISTVAGRALQELVRLTFDGSDEAAKALHGLLVSTVHDFDEFCQDDKHQTLFEPIAGKTSVWPGFLTCDADIQKRNIKLLARLKLGCKVGLNYSGRQWTAIIFDVYNVRDHILAECEHPHAPSRPSGVSNRG